MILLVYHLFSSITNLYFFLWTNNDSGPNYTTIQNLCFLTIMVHTLIFSHNSISFLYDFYRNFLTSKKESEKNYYYKYPNYMYAIYQSIFSYSIVVCVAYWPLRIFFPLFLYPSGEAPGSEIMSSYTHGGNLILFFFEIFLSRQKIPLKFGMNIIIIFFSIIFIILVQIFHFYCFGFHVYPFIKKLNYHQIFIFYSVLFFVALAGNLILRTLINFLWREKLAEKKKKKDFLIN